MSTDSTAAGAEQAAKSATAAPAETKARGGDGPAFVPAQEDAALSIDQLKTVNLSGMSAELVVMLFIDYAVRIGASDLFLCANESEIEVSVRHLGIVRQLTNLPHEIGQRCLHHIRAAAGLKFDERRKPQDGRWLRRYANGRVVDLRLSTMPTLYGDSFAMRILARDSMLRQIDSLGLVGPQQGILLSWLRAPSGLILTTGPTGAGKTSTQYACLQHLNDGRRKIHTIEDPVEYSISGLRQSQVDDIHGPDFATLLRSVLRQSPDVVMIGEVRDAAAAETAVRAANSGHLVFASMHAPIAAGAVQSMLVLGVKPHFLATCLLGVIGQRLVRTLDPATKLSVDLSHAPRTFEEIKDWLQPGQGETVFAAGPDSTGNDGFIGRRGVFEFLASSPAIRRAIYEQRSSGELNRLAIDEGMFDLRRAALVNVATGHTSFDEVLRSIPDSSQWEEAAVV